MIQTFSSTIRRKEMDAVLTCMVDERIGPGELNARLIQTAKEFFSCAGAVALRTPAAALKYALKALSLEAGSGVMLSALAPLWQYATVEELGYKPIVLDVQTESAQITAETVSQGIQNGGRALVLRESLGILPDFEGILSLGIPVIEDVSQSAGGIVPEAAEAGAEGSAQKAPAASEEGDASKNEIKGKKAGSFGIYAICSLEERDVITAGGGALLMAAGRRDWPVLKSLAETISTIEMLPDINAALATVQIKEFARNETKRKEIYALFNRSIMSGKNKGFVRDVELNSTIWAFPISLNSGFKDVKAYAQKKDIEVRLAFEDSIIAAKDEELGASCKNAKALALRSAVFPLYPRLNRSQIEKISKVLVTLP
ncbi:MAG: DegT/DnrJ/EryC1/StrS aminotransferase family protein [Treponema sp.]|nr:DegT/DnrJ/EryC1/StrS aminotransferase family protein [Treponema sp.]